MHAQEDRHGMIGTWSLAVETSGRIGSVALGRGLEVVEARSFSTGLRHAVELLPVAQAIVKSHSISPRDVARICVSAGPGSFTGLRIGVTFARGMALAGGTRIVRVPTLDVLAQNALATPAPPAEVAVILDAKRGRIFAARYALDRGFYAQIEAPAEHDPAAFLAGLPAESALLGEGIAYHREAVDACGRLVLPDDLNRARAEVVHRLGVEKAEQGAFDDAAAVIPIYVRRPEAEEVWERRHHRDRGDRQGPRSRSLED
jgi:tRNA threonylcarbamoyladenosine biosynthesis protein TsaB